jgi:hypothetical protein
MQTHRSVFRRMAILVVTHVACVLHVCEAQAQDVTSAPDGERSPTATEPTWTIVRVHPHIHYRPHRRMTRVWVAHGYGPTNAPTPAAVAVPAPHERADDRASGVDADGRAAGGLALSGGATNFFDLVPLNADMMVGARLHVAAALAEGSPRWLSAATLGLVGSLDVGHHRNVDAQLWRVGAAFSVGAPWSHDVLGVGLEGGLIGGRFRDENPRAYDPSRNAGGPQGEAIGPSFYGLGRLTVQVPLEGRVRPFVAGDLGAAQREGGRVSAIAGVTGGLVWNAW